MPLLINGKITRDGLDCHPVAVFKEYPDLHSASKTFMEKAVSNQMEIDGMKQRLLYVGQSEFAVISKRLNKGSFDYIASDDATTCHLFVMKEPISETIALAHFDGTDMKKGIKDIISAIKVCRDLALCKGPCKSSTKEHNLNLELFLFGGFKDPKHYSEDIFQNILNVCLLREENIELKLACCYSLNNKQNGQENFPIIYGVGVCLADLEFSVVTCTNTGPDMLLRGARLMYNDNKSVNVNIYDFVNGHVICETFVFHCTRYAERLLELPDDIYLKCCSTSPHCEPKHFVESSKSVILFTMKYHERIDKIFSGKTRRCFLNDSFEWKYVDDCHSSL